MKNVLLSLSSFFLTACESTIVRDHSQQTVDHVEIQKFMGDWYVIANVPTFLEEDAANAVESYSWNQEKDRIDVDYHHHKKTPTGELKSYPQKAWIYDKTTNAEWRVQPFWPLKLGYLIVDLAPDYSWTVIGVPNKKHVWIMARKPTLPEATLTKLKKNLKEKGYDLTNLRMIPQVW